MILLAALPLACGSPSQETASRLQLRADAVGPFSLGASLEKASIQAKHFDPGALPVASGCDGRDEFSMRAPGFGTTIMAMADANGRIEEIVVQPDLAPNFRTPDADTCFRQAEAFASKFGNELGLHGTGSKVQKPATVEHSFHFSGGQRIQARWFRGGGNCDFALYIMQNAD